MYVPARGIADGETATTHTCTLSIMMALAARPVSLFGPSTKPCTYEETDVREAKGLGVIAAEAADDDCCCLLLFKNRDTHIGRLSSGKGCREGRVACRAAGTSSGWRWGVNSSLLYPKHTHGERKHLWCCSSWKSCVCACLQQQSVVLLKRLFHTYIV